MADKPKQTTCIKCRATNVGPQVNCLICGTALPITGMSFTLPENKSTRPTILPDENMPGTPNKPTSLPD